MLSTLYKERQSLIWWLLSASIAAALKWHFSAADSAALEWMLRPLSLLLRLLTGWHFQQTPEGDWESGDAGIVLVKACAGINFMIMSFLGWCWLARPQAQRAPTFAIALEWPLLFAASLVFAWLAALLVNTARIIAVVKCQPLLEHWIAPAEAHRLIGLIIYLPALTAQLLLRNRQRWDIAALLAAAIYVGMMLIVPLLTGNAAASPGQYREHALLVLVLALPLAVAGFAGRRYRRR